MARKLSKEELLASVQELHHLSFGSKWQVSSNSEGCPEGYTKVYLRRKRVEPPWKEGKLRVRNFICSCLPDEEAAELKIQIKQRLETLGLS